MMGRSVGLRLTRYAWIIDCGCCDFLSSTSLWFRFCGWIFFFVFHHNFNSSFISFTPMSGLPPINVDNGHSFPMLLDGSRYFRDVPCCSVCEVCEPCFVVSSPSMPDVSAECPVLSYQLAAIGAFHLPQAIRGLSDVTATLLTQVPAQARREQVATTAPGMLVEEWTPDSFVLKQADGRFFPLHIQFRRLCTAFFLCFSGYCVC